MWPGSLLPLGCEAALQPTIACFQIDLVSLFAKAAPNADRPAGASALATLNVLHLLDQ
ncbi:hypothetical protein D3C85_1670390 [compost metagenome]